MMQQEPMRSSEICRLCPLPYTLTSFLRTQHARKGLIVDRTQDLKRIVESILPIHSDEETLSKSMSYFKSPLFNDNVTILIGEPGSGTTTLATLTACNLQIRSHFQDGIAFLRIPQYDTNSDDISIFSHTHTSESQSHDSSKCISSDISSDNKKKKDASSDISISQNGIRGIISSIRGGIKQPPQQEDDTTTIDSGTNRTFQSPIVSLNNTTIREVNPNNNHQDDSLVRHNNVECSYRSMWDHRGRHPRTSSLDFGVIMPYLTYNDLIDCYVTICFQLNLEVPDCFRENNSKGKCNEEGATTISEIKIIRERQRMENARQKMGYHILTSPAAFNCGAKTQHDLKLNSEPVAKVDGRKNILILLDNLWNPEDIQWFQFDSVNGGAQEGLSCHLLVTTRLAAFVFDDIHAKCISIQSLSNEDAVSCLLESLQSHRSFNADPKSNCNDINNKWIRSNNGKEVAFSIAQLCGNLPAAIASMARWICHAAYSNDISICQAATDLLSNLHSSNILKYDLQQYDYISLRRRLCTAVGEGLHGIHISRILKICLASFVKVFCKRVQRRQSEAIMDNSLFNQNNSNIWQTHAPKIYVKSLWTKIIEKSLISNSEFDDSPIKIHERQTNFEEIFDAFVALGMLEEFKGKDAIDGKEMLCVRLPYNCYRVYGEYLFDTSFSKHSEFDEILHNMTERDHLKVTWNEIMVVECLKQSGQWHSLEVLQQGCCNNHSYRMLPRYMIQSKKIDSALSYLTDKAFIRGRLLSIGVLDGTLYHIDDCTLMLECYAKTNCNNSGKEGYNNIKKSIILSFKKICAFFQIEMMDTEDTIGNTEKSVNAMHEMAFFLYKRRWYSESLKINEACLQVRQIIGENNPEVAKSLFCIAEIYTKLEKKKKENNTKSKSASASASSEVTSNIDKAMEYYLEALRIQRATYTPMHKDIALTLIRIGQIKFNEQNFKQAITYMDESLSIHKEIYGIDNNETASTLCSLGKTYFECEIYTKSLTLYEDALKIKQLLLENDHKVCGQIIFMIAKVYKAQNNRNEALQKYKEALKIFKLNGLMRDDPSVVEATLFINWATSNVRRGQQHRENVLINESRIIENENNKCVSKH